MAKPFMRYETMHLSVIYQGCQLTAFYLLSQTNFSIQANSVDPDQTAPKGAAWSGFTPIATDILKGSTDDTQQTTFSCDLNKNSAKGFCVFFVLKVFVFFFCVVLFLFFYLSKFLNFALPGVMLKFEWNQ